MSGLVETDVQVGGRRSRQSNVSVGVEGPVATGDGQDVTDLVAVRFNYRLESWQCIPSCAF